MNYLEPLASKIRPKKISEFIGQEHLVGENKPLKVALDNNHVFSMIFWGPPGVGKTTLARIYANTLNADFHQLSAVSAGKADVRQVIELAKYAGNKKRTILFLDELHRFNKAQQDFLLPYVEDGTLTLIGATTENPSFEVIAPLLSRCRVFVMEKFSDREMRKIITRALNGLDSDEKVKMEKEAKDWLTRMANGDARQAITMIENAHNLYGEVTIESLTDTLQSKHLRYDKKGEEHYNTISAYIKSMRAGNADAAIYYLARMIDAGEDPLFIARRMVIFASEDVGLASTAALLVANEVFEACKRIGYPECTINLAHGTAFLANSKKDRRAYNALRKAQKDVETYGNLPIPLKIRNPVTKLNKTVGYGKDYEMYDKDDLLPDKLKKRKYL